MRNVRRAAMGIVAGVAIALALGALLPRQWQVERAVIINAPAAEIHVRVANFRWWPEWVVWRKAADAQVRYNVLGSGEAGGGERAWLGPRLGRGRLRIVSAEPNEGVRLEGAVESASDNVRASISYSEVGGSTRVTWRDEGTLPPVVGGFIRGLVEDKLGREIETSLLGLKELVETQPR